MPSFPRTSDRGFDGRGYANMFVVALCSFFTRLTSDKCALTDSLVYSFADVLRRSIHLTITSSDGIAWRVSDAVLSFVQFYMESV